jgi:hypothetical protein
MTTSVYPCAADHPPLHSAAPVAHDLRAQQAIVHGPLSRYVGACVPLAHAGCYMTQRFEMPGQGNGSLLATDARGRRVEYPPVDCAMRRRG